MMALPALHPLICFYPAAPDEQGARQWTLHHRLTNRYFRIPELTYTILRYWRAGHTPQSLIDTIRYETGHHVTTEDITALVHFLRTERCVIGELPAISAPPAQEPGWKKWLKHYLFFTIPLVKPDRWLQMIYPRLRFLFHPVMLWVIAGLMAGGIFLTLPRIDEFQSSLIPLMSWSGAFTLMLVFIGIKLVHESAHALACTHYQLPVPHMGIAFMLLVPLPYTETSAMWRLDDRFKRALIGSAGMLAELAIGALALIAWHFFPQGGTGQSIAASVVLISLISSLLINGNPLMRFDGYYVLSDYYGIDNLQDRSIAFARWMLRRRILGMRDAVPEILSAQRTAFLTLFGVCLLVYRFFLFIGIALLVYHIFPKPLGLILMCIELGWFIVRPVMKEAQILWRRRSDFQHSVHMRIVTAVAMVVMLWLVLPLPDRSLLHGVMEGGDPRTIRAPAPATLAEWNARDGVLYQKGDILAILQSDVLEKEITLQQIRIRQLVDDIRQKATSALDHAGRAALDDSLKIARQEYSTLLKERDALIITAPFDGVVRDVDPFRKAGETVAAGTILFHFINPKGASLTLYANESDHRNLAPSARGTIYREDTGMAKPVMPITLPQGNWQGINNLSHPMMASLYEGPITARIDPADSAERIIPVAYTHKMRLSLALPAHHHTAYETPVSEHRVLISVMGDGRPPIVDWARDFLSFLRAHVTLNPDR